MNVVFIVILIVFILGIFFYLGISIYQTYLIKNSIALNLLKEINNKYNFFDCKDKTISDSYDNEKYFENISCQDYLTYYLRENEQEVEKFLKYVKSNIYKYDLYKKEVKNIENFGLYRKNIKIFSKKLLIFFEKKLFIKNQLDTPKLSFNIKVNLSRTDLYGNEFEIKKNSFNNKQITELLKRLNNKTNSFYNDREIWNSLCRVERGKVTNKIRFQIFERDNNCCRICGSTQNLQIDHIKPISKGGRSTYDNLQTLCERCNKIKDNN